MKIKGIKFPFAIGRGNGRVITSEYDYDTKKGSKFKENIQQLLLTKINEWWGNKNRGTEPLALMFKGMNAGFEGLFKSFIGDALNEFISYVVFLDAEFIFDEFNREVTIIVNYYNKQNREEEDVVIQIAA